MSIRKKVLQSTVLLTAARVLQQLLRIASYVILARLLDPADYGMAAMALAPIGFLSMIAMAGMGLAVVSTTAALEKAAPHAFAFVVLATLLAGAGALLAAPYYAHAMGHAELVTLCRVLAIVILCDGLAAVPSAFLHRAMNYRPVAISESSAVFADVGVAITLAALGYGYWSLAWAAVAGATTRFFVIAWYSPKHQWLHRVPWEGAVGRELGRKGASNTGNALLWYTYTNGDYVVTGKLYDAVTLGFYTLGFRIANLPMDAIHGIVESACSRPMCGSETTKSAWPAVS